MPAPVAFVGGEDREKDAAWIRVLSDAMPEERILAFSSMTVNEKNQAEIAITANPAPEDMTALPNLKWIHSLWAGVDHLVAALGEKAPPLVRLVDPELSRVMAEAVLAWVYYLQRDMPAYRRSQAARRWRPRPYRPPSAVSVGILGLGVLGRAAAAALRHAGFAVAGWSRSEKTAAGGVTACSGPDSLDALLHASDIVVLLLPLTRDTCGLMNSRRFAAMKKGAALINFARGPIVDAAAMPEALSAGRLSHAVLDVFTAKPPA